MGSMGKVDPLSSRFFHCQIPNHVKRLGIAWICQVLLLERIPASSNAGIYVVAWLAAL